MIDIVYLTNEKIKPDIVGRLSSERYILYLAAPGWSGPSGPLRSMRQWNVVFGRVGCAGGVLLVYTQPVEKSTILHPKISEPNA